MKTKFKISLLFGMMMNVNVCLSQVSTGANNGLASDYVGWDINQTFPLTIQHENSQPINFYTDAGSGSLNNLRMFIEGRSGNVGIGNFTTANTLLHLHRVDDNLVDFQMTNAGTGNNTNDGFLIDVDPSGLLTLRQQEVQPMQFWGMDARLSNTPVIRAEFTSGQAMLPNSAAQARTDGFRIWNPGYASSGGAYLPLSAIDIWTGESGTTHMRYDHSGLFQGINLQFEQFARLNGFWFNAQPLTDQAGSYRGRYFFNIDSIEVARFSNATNTSRGYMRVGLLPGGGTSGPGNPGTDAARRLEVYDNATLPQFRITQTNGTIYTDFQTTAAGDLFIDPWSGTNSRNVGIGTNSPTAKLEVSSPTITSGLAQTTMKINNNNTGSTSPTGIDVSVLSSSAGVSLARGLNINLNATATTSHACYISNSCSSGASGYGLYSNLTGSNTYNYGIRSDVSGGTLTNIGAYLVTNGGNYAYGIDCYTSNASIYNYSIKSVANGNNSGSIDSRGITASANGSQLNYGGYFTGTANGTNSSFGVSATANGGNDSYGVYAIGSGAANNNFGVYASGSGGSNSWAVYANGNAGGTTLWQSSDATLKNNVSPMLNNTSIIMQLQPKSYLFNHTIHPELVLPTGTHYGLIAQELEQIVPELVKEVNFPAQFDSTGALKSAAFSFKSVNYIEVIPFLIGAIQEMNLELDSLKQLVSSNSAKNTGSIIDNSIETKIVLTNKQGIILNQNDPNPFSESTKIRYFLPEEVNNARLIFSTENGIVIKSVQLNDRGEGVIDVYASDLSNGLYIYTLIVDGKIIESKKMIKQ